MKDVINLSFRYSNDDIARATRSHYASRMRPRLDLVMAILLAAADAYLLRSPGSHLSGVFAVGASGAFLSLLLAAFGVVPALAFRLEPKYRDEYSLIFSQEGIHFRTVHIDSQLLEFVFAGTGRCPLVPPLPWLTDFYRYSEARF